MSVATSVRSLHHASQFAVLYPRSLTQCQHTLSAVCSTATFALIMRSNLCAEDAEMVLRLLITDRWLDPLATAHEAADGGTGLQAPADGPVLTAPEALLWCASHRSEINQHAHHTLPAVNLGSSGRSIHDVMRY